tara:strand:+ start:15 stop:770 length:756 start_codon:yes stop_codon:yes gene_type:complete
MALCGANLNFDAITSASTDLKDSLKSKLGGAGTFTSASDLKSLVDGKASTLTAQVQGLLPTLPTVPPLSLQTELTALAGINLSTPQGLLDYQSKLSSITDNFGDALSSSGFSLDTLVSQLAPSIPNFSPTQDVCELCPNFELPSGATEAIQSAQNSVLAQAEGAVEKIADIQTNVDFDAEISTLTTKANKILADPDVQAQISSDVAAGSAQIEKDISSALDKIPTDLSTVIPEGGISIPNISSKFPKKFPL